MKWTIEEIRQIWQTGSTTFGKYVRLESGEYVFGDVYTDHSALAGSNKAETAAFFRLREGTVEVSGYSMTLNLSWDEKDIEFFTKTFGVPLYKT